MPEATSLVHLLVVAVIVAAMIFGLDHGYQGWSGMLLSAVLALLDLRVLLFVPRAPDSSS